MVDILGTLGGNPLVTNTGAELAVSPYQQADNTQVMNFAVDLTKALLWQYNSATALQSLINSKQDWYDENQKQFWTDFVTNIFDLNTANEFGLAVWSIILDLPLFSNSSYDPTIPTFGFGNANLAVNFDNGILQDSSGSTSNLPLGTKRIALQLRYFQLTSSGTVPETNRMLAFVFRNYGKAYLLDLGNMHQEYVFNFPVPWDFAYLFNNFDILPRPAGVSSEWVDATLSYFGFGPYGLQFDSSILGPN